MADQKLEQQRNAYNKISAHMQNNPFDFEYFYVAWLDPTQNRSCQYCLCNRAQAKHVKRFRDYLLLKEQNFPDNEEKYLLQQCIAIVSEDYNWKQKRQRRQSLNKQREKRYKQYIKESGLNTIWTRKEIDWEQQNKFIKMTLSQLKKELTELEQMKENSQLDRNILEYYYDKDVSETKAIMFKLEERALDVYARKKDLYMQGFLLLFDWIVLFGTIFGLFMLIASPNIIIERYADFEYYKTIAKLFMVTSIFSVFAHRLFKYAMKKEQPFLVPFKDK